MEFWTEIVKKQKLLSHFETRSIHLSGTNWIFWTKLSNKVMDDSHCKARNLFSNSLSSHFKHWLTFVIIAVLKITNTRRKGSELPAAWSVKREQKVMCFNGSNWGHRGERVYVRLKLTARAGGGSLGALVGQQRWGNSLPVTASKVCSLVCLRTRQIVHTRPAKCTYSNARCRRALRPWPYRPNCDRKTGGSVETN